MGLVPISREVYARKEKCYGQERSYICHCEEQSYICHCEERSDEAISYYKHVEIATLSSVARNDNFFTEKKWGQAPFYIGNIHV